MAHYECRKHRSWFDVTADAFVHLPDLRDRVTQPGAIAAAADAGDVRDVGEPGPGRRAPGKLAAVG